MSTQGVSNSNSSFSQTMRLLSPEEKKKVVPIFFDAMERNGLVPSRTHVYKSLKEKVQQGQAPVTLEELKTFQNEILLKCFKTLHRSKDPSSWPLLKNQLNEVKQGDWAETEDMAQLTDLARSFRKRARVVETIAEFLESGRSRYLDHPEVRSQLQDPLLLEKLIQAAPTKGKRFQAFVSDLFASTYTHGNQIPDPGQSPLSIADSIMLEEIENLEAFSPLKEFFRQIEVLGKDGKRKHGILSLKTPFKILSRFFEGQGLSLIQEERFFQEISALDQAMKKKAYGNFCFMLKSLFSRLKENPNYDVLVSLEEEQISIDQKIARSKELLESFHPQHQAFLLEFLKKGIVSAIISKFLIEEKKKRPPIVCSSLIKPEIQWKACDAWERKIDSFQSKEGLKENVHFLYRTFLGQDEGESFSDQPLDFLYTEFFAFFICLVECLKEQVENNGFNPFYHVLIEKAFWAENIYALAQIAQMIFYEKYLIWVEENLPEDSEFRREAFALDALTSLQTYQKIERESQRILEADELTEEQKEEAEQIIRGFECVMEEIQSCSQKHLAENFQEDELQLLSIEYEESLAEDEKLRKTWDLEKEMQVRPNNLFGLFFEWRGLLSGSPSLLTREVYQKGLFLKRQLKQALDELSENTVASTRSLEETAEELSKILLEQFLKDKPFKKLPPDLQARLNKLLSFSMPSLRKLEEIIKNLQVAAHARKNPEIDSVLAKVVALCQNPSPEGNPIPRYYQYEAAHRPSSLTRELFSCLGTDDRGELSLEDHCLQKEEIVQFAIGTCLKECDRLRVDVRKEFLGPRSANFFSFGEGLAMAVWARYQEQFQRLSPEQKALLQVKKGQNVNASLFHRIKESRQNIRKAPEELVPAPLKQELFDVLSLRFLEEKLRKEIGLMKHWVKEAADREGLSYEAKAFEKGCSIYEDWKTVRKTWRALFFHVKSKIEQAGLSDRYIPLLELTCQSLNREHCGRLLEEIAFNLESQKKRSS